MTDVDISWYCRVLLAVLLQQQTNLQNCLYTIDDDEADDATASRNIVKAVPSLDALYGQRDLGKDAVCWSLSSAKPGNGVDQIRDSSVETYWQSDGGQPHSIQIVFSRRVAVSHVCLYLDFNLDESYTPKKVCIDAGMTLQDLQTLSIVELSEPVGWCIIPLEAPPDPLDNTEENENLMLAPMPIRTHLVQISVLSMHQNGRDTHVRQVKLFGPRREQVNRNREDHNSNLTMPMTAFQTVELSQFSTIR